MEREAQVDSLVALDIGSVNTKAVLIGRVEGAYRFIARAESATTLEAPWSDVAIGARHALEKLAAAAGRPLLDERGMLITPQR
ncbi:MAG TPA: glutamate mutase L, partial [Anaerolineae bacterium]|nr:glutamate mutase L [Anaerolineae bacterium]